MNELPQELNWLIIGFGVLAGLVVLRFIARIVLSLAAVVMWLVTGVLWVLAGALNSLGFVRDRLTR